MTVEDNIILDTKNIDLRALGVPKEREAEAREMLERHVETEESAIRKSVSPPGSIVGLSPLLEERRLHWQIPDGVFRAAGGALFDRVLLFQIDPVANSPEEATRMGSIILKPDQTRDKDMRGAPRAVLVGAGLGARDALRAHGVELGHIVYFAKNTLYTIVVDKVDGKEKRLSVARCGDFISSQDLARAYAAGEVSVGEVETKDEQGVTHIAHYYVDKEGRRFNPVNPDPGDML